MVSDLFRLAGGDHAELGAELTRGGPMRRFAEIDEIVEVVYRDVDRALHPLASRSVDAHLVLLFEEGRIASSGHELVALPTNPT